MLLLLLIKSIVIYYHHMRFALTNFDFYTACVRDLKWQSKNSFMWIPLSYIIYLFSLAVLFVRSLVFLLAQFFFFALCMSTHECVNCCKVFRFFSVHWKSFFFPRKTEFFRSAFTHAGWFLFDSSTFLSFCHWTLFCCCFYLLCCRFFFLFLLAGLVTCTSISCQHQILWHQQRKTE